MLPRQKLQGAVIRESLTTAHNIMAWTEIMNETDEHLDLVVTDPVHSLNIDLQQFHIYFTDTLSVLPIKTYPVP